MKGIYAAYILIVVAYFGVSIAGFAAFGNSINPDILLSISKPQWLIKAANLMVVVHVAASFQVRLEITHSRSALPVIHDPPSHSAKPIAFHADKRISIDKNFSAAICTSDV